MPRQRLLALVDGNSQRETLLPLLGVLCQRGRIEVRAVTRIRPRLRSIQAALEVRRKGVTAALRVSAIGSKALRRELDAVDAVLVISDPMLDLSKEPERSSLIREREVPTLFVQHGMVQSGVNVPHPFGHAEYHSAKLLLWQLGARESQILSPDALQRSVRVGFLKESRGISGRPPAALRRWAAAHAERLLFCLPPMTEYQSSNEATVARIFQILEALLEQSPRVGVLVRCHRNQHVPAYEERLRRLARRFPGLALSAPRPGAAGLSLETSLDLCSIVLAPPSTMILDAAYRGLAVGLLLDSECMLPEVPVIKGPAAVTGLKGSRQPFLDAASDVRRRYGDLKANLERAAEVIEDELLGSARASAPRP
jgi:hypothetical protein